MAKLPIIIAPDPRLKVKCRPVERVNAEIRRLMDDMLETMYAAPGIGLAAPQVGVARRVIVADVAREGAPPSPLRMANPELVWASAETIEADEGCLSLPDQFELVVRPGKARIRYLDQDNAAQEIEAEALLAKCILHEMDHLDGTLFVDRISALKRGIILRRLAKLKKHGELPSHAVAAGAAL